jgi:hypothetical protein
MEMDRIEKGFVTLTIASYAVLMLSMVALALT